MSNDDEKVKKDYTTHVVAIISIILCIAAYAMGDTKGFARGHDIGYEVGQKIGYEDKVEFEKSQQCGVQIISQLRKEGFYVVSDLDAVCSNLKDTCEHMAEDSGFACEWQNNANRCRCEVLLTDYKDVQQG